MKTCVMRWFVPAAGALGLMSGAFAGPSGGQGQWKAFRDPTVQDFGHQWSRVGDPHNSPFVYDDPSPFIPPRNAGRVDHKFRVMTREVTVREWYGFLQAYAPYVAFGTAQSPGLIGPSGYIQYHGYSNGLPQYSIVEQFADLPMQANWRHAARYANYLHNDQADAAWAFESGAYDTSTFGTTQNGQGINILTDQAARSEGARFWIPSMDEWTKAGHWDPNRYGDGEGGWWQYPTTSDTAPVSGHPDSGGETNGGVFPQGQSRPLDVGSYPDVQSPWGLLDLSGGAQEWMEDFRRPERPQARVAGGTSIYIPNFEPALGDQLGFYASLSPTSFAGIRLASVIPSPGSLLLLSGLGVHLSRRHRHEDPASPAHRSAVRLRRGTSDHPL